MKKIQSEIYSNKKNNNDEDIKEFHNYKDYTAAPKFVESMLQQEKRIRQAISTYHKNLKEESEEKRPSTATYKNNLEAAYLSKRWCRKKSINKKINNSHFAIKNEYNIRVNNSIKGIRFDNSSFLNLKGIEINSNGIKKSNMNICKPRFSIITKKISTTKFNIIIN